MRSLPEDSLLTGSGLQDHPLYSLSSCHVFQHDLTLPLPVLSDKLAQSPPEFGDPVQEEDFDIVSCIFVLSALAPRTHAPALETLLSVSESPWVLPPGQTA